MTDEPIYIWKITSRYVPPKGMQREIKHMSGDRSGSVSILVCAPLTSWVAAHSAPSAERHFNQVFPGSIIVKTECMIGHFLGQLK